MLSALYRRLFGPSRGIFRFWDGQRYRAVDPFVILANIEADHELNLELDSALVLAGDSAAIARTVRATRRAFGVKDFASGGLLEAECLELIGDFYDFLGALKKNTSASPTLSPPTQESSSASTDPLPSPGKSSSDSPKTPSEANCASQPG